MTFLKKIFFCLFLIFFNCKPNKAIITNEIKNNEILLEGVFRDSNVIIVLSNKSSKQIEVNTPCTTNTFLYLFDNKGIEVSRIRLIRPFCKGSSNILKSGESKEFVFPYKLSSLYSLNSGKTYNAYLEYIFSSKGNRKLIKSSRFKIDYNL